MSELGIYVYGLVPERALEEAPTVTGIDGSHTIELVMQGQVGALISKVSIDQFGEDRLMANLSDLSWVEQTARRHQQVLDDVIEDCTPIPMRLCTVYSDEDSLREMLAHEHDNLAAGLRELDSKLEWGVKAFVQQAGGTEREMSTAPVAQPATGTAYLQRRLAQRTAREQRQAHLEEACDHVHRELCSLAADCRMGELQRPEVSGRESEMVCNASYLVANEHHDRFCLRFTGLRNQVAELGLDLELTGPWPPYNFVPASIGGTR